jgi:two-component system cell cycle response regulator DivK
VMTGFELFNVLRDQPNLNVDLILLDIQIPGEDGYGVLRRIRKEPRLANTKVLAVTANVMPQDVERARQAGFDGFIGKPLQFTRFPEQIQRVLQGESVWEPH